MKGIVDRFEGEFVVIEIDGATQDVVRSAVNPNVKEGDVVRLINGVWQTDEDETDIRSKKIKNLMDSVWGD